MGEFADDASEQEITEFLLERDSEAWKDLGVEDLYIPFKRKATMICKWCGGENLLWKKIDGRWKLIENDGTIHKCFYFE
jgi:hypothetical protein